MRPWRAGAARGGRRESVTRTGRAAGGRPIWHLAAGRRRRSAITELADRRSRRTGASASAEQTLIVVPPALRRRRRDVLGGTARSASSRTSTPCAATRNWGVGDLGDLAALAAVGCERRRGLRRRESAARAAATAATTSARTARSAASFGIRSTSTSRRFPSCAHRAGAATIARHRRVQRRAGRAARASDRVRLRAGDGAEGPALDALHRVFRDRVRGSRQRTRERAYECLAAQGGPALDALRHLDGDRATSGARATDRNWREWPAEFRDPRSRRGARGFASRTPSAIDFHRWLQFELDRQLGERGGRARAAGMRDRLYQDLADRHVARRRATPWAFPELFVSGASVGAPPDPYSATGQNWGLPPIDPRALGASAIATSSSSCAAAFATPARCASITCWDSSACSGFPQGQSGERRRVRPLSRRGPARHPRAGERAPRRARRRRGPRHGAARRAAGARDAGACFVEGAVLRARRRWRLQAGASYAAVALATANTHDMPTIDGFWRGRDIELRREVGLIGSDERGGAGAPRSRRGEARAARDAASARRCSPTRCARELARDDASAAARAVLRGAVHAFLCRTPSALVGLSLDDLVGEREPVNVPGVGNDKFRAGRGGCAMPLEAAADQSRTSAAALRCERASAEGGDAPMSRRRQR